jgi:hypothetical protein
LQQIAAETSHAQAKKIIPEKEIIRGLPKHLWTSGPLLTYAQHIRKSVRH